MFDAIEYLKDWSSKGGECEIYERFTLVSCSSPLFLLDDFQYLGDVIKDTPRIFVLREIGTDNYYKMIMCKNKDVKVVKVVGSTKTIIDFS